MAHDELQIHVPWQATAAFFGAFAGAPLLFIGCMYIFAEHGYMAREFGLIAIGLASPFLIWCAFALRSRFRKGREAGEPPAAFVKWLAIGLGAMLLAVAINLIAQAMMPNASGVYVVPGGLFLSGAALFVRAMTPPKSV